MGEVNENFPFYLGRGGAGGVEVYKISFQHDQICMFKLM
jgi:hypothetical protein